MEARAPILVGRYAIYDRIAAGGMATVHVGRLVGERGFSRTVAIKRLHAHFAMDPDFVGMFLDEARLAARIRHPNVVQTLDVVVAEGEVFLVMDYVEGESLAHLMRILLARNETMPPACASALIAPVLHGLHAAHEAKNDHGEPLGLVHRDVSPQNVLVGIDGVPRVLDFGVAKALGQSHTTREGQLKGKLAYMAPEQIEIGRVDRRTDVFAASVVLWEVLAGRRLFKAEGEAQVMRLVLYEPMKPPSDFVSGIPPALDAVVMRGLERNPEARFATAEQMADALEDAAPPMPSRKLAAWVQRLLGDQLSTRAKLVQEIESASTNGKPDLVENRAPLTKLDPPMESMDVTVALDSLEEPLAQASSQASSISVEAPRRGSMSPHRTRRSPLLIGGGVAVCIGVIAVVAAIRGLHDEKGSAAATGEVPSPPPVAASPPPPNTPVETPWVAVTANPTTTAISSSTPTANANPIASPTANPTATTVVSPRPAPASRPPAPPTQRASQPAPQPSSKLYSRF